MSLHTCALCGHYTDLPDAMWTRLSPLVQGALRLPDVETCSPRCLVLWLKREHKPNDIGVRL